MVNLLAQLSFYVSGIEQMPKQHLVLSQRLERRRRRRNRTSLTVTGGVSQVRDFTVKVKSIKFLPSYLKLMTQATSPRSRMKMLQVLHTSVR